MSRGKLQVIHCTTAESLSFQTAQAAWGQGRGAGKHLLLAPGGGL